jgi:hypothetical protein
MYNTYTILLFSEKRGWLKNNNMLPEKAIRIPAIFIHVVRLPKNNAPTMITKMGVREFNVPARALSTPCSAIQNKYAGSRLPITPDRNTIPILLRGISRNARKATGRSTRPDEMILNDATWKAVRCTSPSLIRIKLLPQMMERIIKRNQLMNLGFKVLYL